MSHPVRVNLTQLAAEDRRRLSGQLLKRVEQKLDELVAQGCAEAGYRLQGAAVERICAVHVGANMRLLSAFPAPGEIWVLLIGPHEDQNPNVDVYRSLYRALGLDDYPPGNPEHPDDCCLEDGYPPVDSEVLDRFLQGSQDLARERPYRGRSRRRPMRQARRGR